MNEVNPESKTAAIKTLAIIGFIGAVALVVFIAVQVVRFAPDAWKSLASMAESVYGKNVILSVTTEKDIVNSGETFEVSWNDVRKEGAYSFTFICTDGVAAEVRDIEGSMIAATCDTPVTLSAESRGTDVVFTSEKGRFVDVPFSIRFTAAGNADNSQEKSYTVTVVNESILEDGGEVASDTDTETPQPTTGDMTSTPQPTTGSTEAPKPAPQVPTGTIKVPYVVAGGPASNPNGFTDLKIEYIGVGSYNQNTKVFTPKSSLDNDDKAALRFSVQNIGTKTSGTFTYRVTLPDDNSAAYTSPAQNPLVPTEKAIITILIDDVTEDTGTKTIKGEIRTTSDILSSNNTFSRTVKIVN